MSISWLFLISVIMLLVAALYQQYRLTAALDSALVKKDAALVEKDAALVEKDAALVEKDAALVEKDVALAAALIEKEAAFVLLSEKDDIINDVDLSRKRAVGAQKDAEAWRVDMVKEVYKDVSDDELDEASRWIAHAQPMAEIRSCLSSSLNSTFWLSVGAEADIINKMQDIHASSFVWNDDMRRQYIALHAFHSTGIEGNTLSLPETHLVVDNKPLFAGFKEDSMATKVMQTSISEVRNFMQIFDALKLSHPAGHAGSWTSLSTQRLVDINSAITRDMGTPTGLRTHAVSVGHQRILLPQADEVPKLIALYLAWLNSAVKAIAVGDDYAESDSDSLVPKVLALACDAHTRFVHIHPFSDCNGRLARILSALVLQTFGLPAPMFRKQDREQYIAAVGSGTIKSQYGALCGLHVEAVERSLQVLLESQQS